MARVVETCLFCGVAHRGACATDKPPPKKRTPKAPAAPRTSPALPVHVDKSDASGPGPEVPPVKRPKPSWNFQTPPTRLSAGEAAATVSPSGARPAPAPVSGAQRSMDRWALAGAATTDELSDALAALASIMHEEELEKHGLRRPTRPQLTARVRAWRDSHGT